MPKMAHEFMNRDVLPDVIFSSISVRTRQTVGYIQEGLNYPEEHISFHEEIYEASTGSLLKFINSIKNEYQSAMIVGHNPSISYLCEYLTDEVIGNVPTGGILKITFDFSSWELISKSTGSLEWTIFPKELGF